ncbi:RidA family protein [Jiangella anatolica]|uniref:Enamine deaminase RidA n=1 Tax=Jiangella anatolica TaxID=2670374 RepID=A0A2W2C2V1_9ACTN|nr:RidA family protein [Jiangella anatolica]PZF82529.1 enamine deaminase RidA [Jiangella anatolica]
MSTSRTVIAPWPGDENLAFLQGGVEVSATRTLYLSGQAALADGRVLHEGDLRAQVMTSLDRTQTALDAAGYTWADVVRFNWYLRADQLEAFLTEVQPAFKQRLDAAGCRAPGVLLGVASLALPGMLCEFEATAAR